MEDRCGGTDKELQSSWKDSFKPPGNSKKLNGSSCERAACNSGGIMKWTAWNFKKNAWNGHKTSDNRVDGQLGTRVDSRMNVQRETRGNERRI